LMVWLCMNDVAPSGPGPAAGRRKTEAPAARKKL
jgi:hypothetical protein